METMNSARIHPARLESSTGNIRKNMSLLNSWRALPLPDLGLLRIRGADAVAFLQGQLSSDISRLGGVGGLGADGRPGRGESPVQLAPVQLAGYHNPQGRVIALLRLVRLGPQDILAVLPRERVATVSARLRRYVLRSKVRISDEPVRDGSGGDETGKWEIYGLMPELTASSLTSEPLSRPLTSRAPANEPPSPSLTSQAPTGGSPSPILAAPLSLPLPPLLPGILALPWDSERWLLLAPPPSVVLESTAPQSVAPVQGGAAQGTVATLQATLTACSAATANDWRLADIAAGLPQVSAVTAEAFVAQMLNLDQLGAIAFDKGCYTGQEVIARAHYRGRVKRRMQRFLTDAPAALQAGDAGVLTDGRAFKVVEAARHADGRCEFLAVAPLVVEGEQETEGTTETEGTLETRSDQTTAAARPPLAARMLPLLLAQRCGSV
jgi:folate-binding protein YgfZ